MSRRQFKSQASSSRATAGNGTGFGGFGSGSAGSTLSYLTEPPNLASISDANVVVAFKNLMKKDSTTKAKGLEDLRLYAQSHPYEQDGGVEKPILEAWVKLYPRVSIDNSRRVRELSHTLQYELLKSAQKGMEKFIPKIVGAWLAGTYDRDRPVSKAATDGLNSFLETEEKVLSFWRRCQTKILEFAQEAIEETPETLSDERTVNADDFQAKFDRVVGASLSLVVNLLTKLSDHDVNKHLESYKRFITGNKTLWGFIASKDAFVRRTAAQLLLTCLEMQPCLIEEDLETVASAFIDQGLRSSQLSSSLAFVRALDKLTTHCPTAWTTSYKGKKSPINRLRHFIMKGSQSGPVDYWVVLNSLLVHIPRGVLPGDLTGSVDFLKSLGDGISSREEPRTNLEIAWICYINVAKHLQSNLSDPNDKNQLLLDTVYPLFEHFIRPTPDNSRWSTNDTTAALAKAFHLCVNSETHQPDGPIRREWKRLADIVTTDLRTSLPEQSKDYQSSQESVAAEAHRWFKLQSEILKYSGADRADTVLYKDVLIEASSSIINGTLEVMIARNGKPFGAAGALEGALRFALELLIDAPSIVDSITSFLDAELPKLIVSPSSSLLIKSLKLVRQIPGRDIAALSTWDSTINTLVSLPASKEQAVAMEEMVSSRAAAKLARSNIKLQEFILAATSKCLQEAQGKWRPLFEAAIKFHSLNSKSQGELLDIIMADLDVKSPNSDNAVELLEFILGHYPQLLEDEDARLIIIMTKLLAMGESIQPGMHSKANYLRSAISNLGVSAGASYATGVPIVSIIQDNLEAVGPQSLSVETLVTQADTISTSLGIEPSSLFPDYNQWHKILQPAFEVCPDPSLSLTNMLGGAVALISPEEGPFSVIARDQNGYSAALRMAMYTSKLIERKNMLKYVEIDTQVNLLYLLCLTVEMANDQLSLQKDGLFWRSLDDSKIEKEVHDFITNSQRVIVKFLSKAGAWRDASASGQSKVTCRLVSYLLEKSRGKSTAAFYAGCILASVLSVLVESHGWNNAGGEQWLMATDVLKASTPDIFTAIAILAGLKGSLESSKFVNNLCNRLLSDVTGVSIKSDRTLSLLNLTNATLAVYEKDIPPVSHNRLVFAVKQVTNWMDESKLIHPAFAAEACKCLQLLFPAIKDVYGPYWKSAIEFCVSLWMSEPAAEDPNGWLAAIHAALRLIILLRNIREPNDDLEEALENSEKQISEGLIHLLGLTRAEHENQPWRIVDELICRQVTKMPLKYVSDLSEIYPLVAADFPVVQSAAFSILHRAIPAAQEQITLDVLLENKDAELPGELLSLLLDPPLMENFSDEALLQFPPPIRTYLLTWHLIFDSFTTASHKVRSDYTSQLKSENLIPPLLNFLFDVLGHSVGQPLNLDRAFLKPEIIRSYDIEGANAEKKEFSMQWLLIHLYFLCLKFTPGLTKNWYVECKSKQTRLAVESWTEKSFSPLVIEDTLDDVEKWATEQEAPADDEKELIVKVSKKSKEVYAGYEVDEMTMQIVIRFPPVYPLEGIKVEGVNRVAVSEKKWQSWLMITQGVITFSNGSITDGLLAFRRNVTGALKGQTECAICYSIVSSDKKMPDKRCQTCKHLFHSSCLFKWFASSNQSTCPLCRNPFNYGTDIEKRARRRGGPEV